MTALWSAVLVYDATSNCNIRLGTEPKSHFCNFYPTPLTHLAQLSVARYLKKNTEHRMIHRYSQDSIVFMCFFLPEDFKTNVAFSRSGKSTNFNCNDM